MASATTAATTAATGGASPVAATNMKLVVDRLFPSEAAKQYFFDSSPNVLLCGLPNAGKSSIIDVVFYKASPHETLGLNPSNSSYVHSIAHTPFFRCTIIDLVLPAATAGGSTTGNQQWGGGGVTGGNFNNDQLSGSFHFATLPSFTQANSTLSIINQMQLLGYGDLHSNGSNDLLNLTATTTRDADHQNFLRNPPRSGDDIAIDGNSDSTNIEAEEIFFSRIDSVVLVVDSQNDSFMNDINYSKEIFRKAWKYNKDVKFEVFLHKIDSDVLSSDEYRMQSHQLIYEKLFGILEEEKIKNDIMFYSTSIYDHTIFEAISRVVQNLSNKVLAYGQLLDTLVGNCKMEHAILMDIHSKTFIATDCSAFDPFNYELSSEMIEVMLEISSIYGEKPQSDVSKSTLEQLAQSQIKGKVSSQGSDAATNTVDKAASCAISLNTGYVLYSTEIDRFVVLICIIRSENFEFQHLVDYNIRVLSKAALQLVNFK